MLAEITNATVFLDSMLLLVSFQQVEKLWNMVLGKKIAYLKDEVLSFKEKNMRILLQLNAIVSYMDDLKVRVALIMGVGVFYPSYVVIGCCKMG